MLMLSKVLEDNSGLDVIQIRSKYADAVDVVSQTIHERVERNMFALFADGFLVSVNLGEANSSN